eukprot:GILJ01007808.1.p1 GENE.GILJ01007808.1~~GILJ01007808.1.p1  ORF type:complete len:107 (+),score=16.56 GILJ01007808.1:42-362(+)
MASGDSKHTIVLAQFTQNKNTRTYIDYENLNLALDGICQLYEQKLKLMNPHLKNITYDIAELFNYIDALGDLSCLVFSPSQNAYVPHNKEWIKTRVFEHLKKLAQS